MILLCAFAFVCLHCSTSEDVFLLEVSSFRRVTSFEYMGKDELCPIERGDFDRAAQTLVELFELDEGRFWIRGSDLSVQSEWRT